MEGRCMSTPRQLDDGVMSDGTAASPEERERGVSRRAFVASGVGVGVAAGRRPFGRAAWSLADKPSSTRLGKGDAAILRFLAAAEILETDLWQQYNELVRL